MKILLYGGSFDPPHNGHLNNLRAAADRVRPDKIVVMPAGTSPFKEGTNASGALRLEMCRCFAALAQEPGMPPLEVSGWEVAQAAAGSRNYTVLTLEMLARETPVLCCTLPLAAICCSALRLAPLAGYPAHCAGGGHQPGYRRCTGAARKGKAAGPVGRTHPVCPRAGAAYGKQPAAGPACRRRGVQNRTAGGSAQRHPARGTISEHRRK